ncbi:hypothetical protein NDA16_000466 [Ustilago loliicola]|nr:hypothetical protein NDA16_000466 [Ustilago loliicola]
MAAFKGGPALPKRSETMSSSTTNDSPNASPSKHKRRTTHLLANPPDDSSASQASKTSAAQSDDLLFGMGYSTRIMDTERDIKPQMTFEGGETAVPMSKMRSTIGKRETVDVMEEDDDMYDDESQHQTPRKVGKIGAEMKDVKPALPQQPVTPKKQVGRKKSTASSSKDVMKTPTKKEAGSGPSTPRTPEQAPLASAWSPDHWNDLNFAILKVVHDHASELYDASPSLLPWKVKGRLLVKLRQLMKEASGGDVASKRWDTELKPTRNKGGSPKKQPQ